MASGKSYDSTNTYGIRRKALDKSTGKVRVLAPRSIRKNTKKHYMDDVTDAEIGHFVFGFNSDEIKNAASRIADDNTPSDIKERLEKKLDEIRLFREA